MMLRQTAKKALLGFSSQRNVSPISFSSRLCHSNVIDHYENPRNVGSFDKNDPNVGTGMVGAPASGDVAKFQIKFDSTGRIIDARQRVIGCGSSIVASSVASEWVKDRSVEEVLAITKSQIAKHLSLTPVKLHCSMLAEDAVKAAVKDYMKKQAEASGETAEA